MAKWSDDPLALADAVGRCDRSAVAAALNLIEDRRPEARERARRLIGALPEERLTSSGQLVGLTGPPGVGKSSLAAEMIREWRRVGRRVGVLAVDPTSPFSGGALLGDRLRMMHDRPDDAVFIRSLAGRGELGGLSEVVCPMSLVLLAAFDVVLIETIGVGQTEVDISLHSDTPLLVVQPASGDTLQFLKAGVTEIPAVIAVNKSDLGQPAKKAAREVRAALRKSSDPGDWSVPVLLVSALEKQGITELCAGLDDHGRWLLKAGQLQKRRGINRASWGLKRILNEFGRFGLEAVGGQDKLMRAWYDSPLTLYETLERFRAELLSRWNAAGDID